MTSAPPIETASPGIGVPSGAHLRRFESEQTSDYLDYYLFVPKGVVSGMPLLVFLHGDGEVGDVSKLEDLGPVHALQEIYGGYFPFIVVSPCTRQESWTNGTIPETLMELIDAAAAECEADPERIIITGHSRGAMGVWYLVSEYGDYFSAAVPVSCGSGCALDYENLAKVPIYALAGDNGKYENIYRTEMEHIVSEVKTNGGDAVIACLEGCGHIDTLNQAYTRKLFNWMLE